jgi:exopolyphosphatase
MARQETLAAVDLGSNSFHLQIGRVVDGQIYPLDSLREVVRIGGGLTADKRIDRSTQARALAALRRFGERLRGFPRQSVRAVGTNTLRVAKNAPQFLREARQELGFPIEVIAGREEARLIYLGVAHSMPPAPHRRLVVDVGGGSTEFIVGEGLEPQLTESLYMGCVSYSLRYFPEARIDKARFKAAELAARQEVSGIALAYRALGWQEAVSSSGTARSNETILRENGFAEQGITREGLERLRSLLLKHERADPDRIAGLRANRAPVLPGGLAILCAGACAHRRYRCLHGAKRGGHDHFHSQIGHPLEPPQKLHPIHARHLEVAEHQVGLKAVQSAERLEAVGSRLYLVTLLAQNLSERIAGVRFVVNDQDSCFHLLSPIRNSGLRLDGSLLHDPCPS